MIIKEVNIICFGKLQNRTFSFSNGLNVIYGENEAGKSTLQQFIKAMLFGLEKKRGRSLDNEYQRFEPWESPAYFAGSLIFETGGQRFLLERNFYHKEPMVRLVNMRDLEELSVEKGDLAMLLGNVSKSAYENTYCISQAKQLPQAALGTLLADERANLAQTKDASFQLSHALDRLEQKKKQLLKEKKEAEQKRQEQLAGLTPQQALLERQMGQQYEKIASYKAQEAVLEEKMRRTKAREQALKKPEEQARPQEITHSHDTKRQWNPLVIIGVLGILIMQILYSWMSLPQPVCRGAQGGFLVVMILGLAAAVRKNTKEEKDQEQVLEKNWQEEARQRAALQDEQAGYYGEYRKLQIARETLEQEIQEQEVLLENNRQQQQEFSQISQREAELARELEAIALAAETMELLSGRYAQETDDFVNSRMSQILSSITSGKYDDLSLEESKQLYLTENYTKRKPESYSQATMQQMYFAYRMAAGELLAQEEPLPFLLDEAFGSYDENRLREVLGWLADQERQVLLFTCRHAEQQILRQLGESFVEIAM